MGKLIILNYHEIIADKKHRIPSLSAHFKVKKSTFIQHLDQIQHMGIPVVSLADWLSGEINVDLAVALTFDDGFKSDFEVVKPVLESRGLTAAFFPVLKFVNQKNRMTWDEIRSLSEAGFEIGSHSVTHCNMRKLQKEPCKLELELSKRLLEQKIGTQVSCFAAPYGAYSRQLLKLAILAGYKHVFSTRVGLNNTESNFVLHRWNIKWNTNAKLVEKVLTKGSMKYRSMWFWSKLKAQFSPEFGMAFMQANLQVLKRIDQ